MAYKVLIIGCGAIAGGYDADRSPDDWPLSHAGAIARDERFDIWACYDTDDDARYDFMERWNVPICLGELEPPFAKPGDFDVIVIASPTKFHAEHLEAALELRPRLVFCEKPLADSHSAALVSVARFREANITLCVNYTRRWAPDLIELQEQIHEGDWGSLVSGVGTYSKGIMHNGSHMLDLLSLFVGEMALEATGAFEFDHWSDDPSVSALLATAEGKPIHLVAGNCQAVTQFELVLNYERGEIAMRDGGMRIETRRVQDSETFAGYRQLGSPESVAGRYPEAMSRAYDNIANTLETEAPLASPARDAFKTHELCEEIRQQALQALQKDPE